MASLRAMAELTDVGPLGLVLVLGFPILLIVGVVMLGRLESWMLSPDERAVAVTDLLERLDDAEAVERAATVVIGDVRSRRASNGGARGRVLRRRDATRRRAS